MPYTTVVPKGSAPPLASTRQARPSAAATRKRRRIVLKDLKDYAAMNEVYREFFPANPPARYCSRADLVKPELLVEIASIAHL